MTTARYSEALKNPKVKLHILLTLDIESRQFLFVNQKTTSKNINILDVTEFYDVGTAIFTNGSKTVTGSGTTFTDNVFADNWITNTDDNKGTWHRIDTVDTDTQITLKDAFHEDTASGARYKAASTFRTLNFKAGFVLRSKISTSINLKNMTSPKFRAQCSISGKEGIQDIRDNFTLTKGTGELALWIEGLSYQDRFVIGKGLIRNPSWGEDFELFNFDLIDASFKRDRKFPPNRIDIDNFPGSNKISFAYPVLYGDFIKSPAYFLGDTRPTNNLLYAPSFSGTEKIYKTNKFSKSILDSFTSPSSPVAQNISGLTFDGLNVYCSSDGTNKIYKLSGTTSVVNDSFASPTSRPRDLLWFDGNLYHVGLFSQSSFPSDVAFTPRVYKFSGFTNLQLDSFSSIVTGITHDNDNFILIDSARRLLKLDGFSRTVTNSIAASNYGQTITFDGNNFITARDNDDRIIRFSGFSNAVLTSFDVSTSNGVFAIETEKTNRYMVSQRIIESVDSLQHNNSSFSATDQGTDTDLNGNTYSYIETGVDSFEDQKVVVTGKGIEGSDEIAFKDIAEIVQDIFLNFSGFTASELDEAAFETAKALLSQWKVGTIFNASGTGDSFLFETLNQRISKQFPVVLLQREGLQSIQVIQFDNIFPVLKLRRNKNIIRTVVNPHESDIDNVKNKFSINYKYNPLTNQFDGYKFKDATNNSLCSLSQNKFDFSEAKPILAIDIVSDIVADLLLDFFVLRDAFVHLLITYECTLDASEVEEGQWVSVTDDRYGFTDKLFMVLSKTYSKELNSVVLSLRENTAFTVAT